MIHETACAVVEKLRSGEVTPLDLLDVLEQRIAEVDGKVNALPTLCFDRARDRAKALMKKPIGERGLLAGLPVPIKDLTNVEGVLNTQGSPIFKDNISAHSDIAVEHLEANGGAALAMTNSFVATAAAALSWMFAEWIIKGHPSVLGAISGAVAGLVAVTPAAGYSGPMGAIVLGLVVGVACLFFVTVVKNALGYDDSLDVFGVHCIGGIVGALGTGILVSPFLGGTGIMDYTTGKIADYDMWTQLISQGKAVGTTLVWSGVGSMILYKVVDVLVGLRPSPEAEREGLDLTDHGERAYDL